MKVESGGRITLSGPLSRNDNLKSLVIGDRIDVRILERISKDSAVIDLKGNKVLAKFSSPLPQSDRFTLTLTKVTSDSLQFSLKTLPHDFFLKSMTHDGIIPPDRLRTLIAALNSGTVGLFDLSLILSGSKNDSNSLALRRFLTYLLHKGFNPAHIPVASALLLGMDVNDITTIYNILEKAGLLPDSEDKTHNSSVFHADAREPDADDVRLILETVSRRADSAELFFIRDGDLCSMNFLNLGESFAGRIETPHLGVIDFLVQLSQGCNCTLSCRDSQVRGELAERAADIRDALVRHYGKGSVQLFTLAEIREKVIALTDEVGNHTFNVTV